MRHVKFAALAAVIAFCVGAAMIFAGALFAHLLITVFDAWGLIPTLAVGFGLLLAVSAFIAFLIHPWED